MSRKEKIVIGSLVLLTMLVVLVVGCASPAMPTSTAATTITDDAGRTLDIPSMPQRIISLAPNNTEILFALGLGDRVVGVSDWSNYPPEAQGVESVGGLPLNREKIVSLEPDLLLAAGTTGAEDITWMEERGLLVLVLNPTDIEGVLRDIGLVGRATGTEEEASQLVAQMRADYQAIVSKTEGADKVRVFLELDETLYTVGPGSFLDDLIELSGGENIASDAKSPYPQFSAEEVVARDPEVIVLGDAAYGVTPEVVVARPGWEAITAVKSGAVYPIDSDIISRPGPRIVQGLRQLARLIHPELFE